MLCASTQGDQQSAQRAKNSQVWIVCWSQAPFPQLCHHNVPVSYEEHQVSQFQLFQESFYSLLFDNMPCLLVLFHGFVLKLCVLYAQFITPGICCSEWHQPGNVTWQFIAQRNHYSFPFLSFCDRGATFKKGSLSLPRCSLALQPSHIANCSYHHSEMLQSICWIHRVKSGRRK